MLKSTKPYYYYKLTGLVYHKGKDIEEGYRTYILNPNTKGRVWIRFVKD